MLMQFGNNVIRSAYTQSRRQGGFWGLSSPKQSAKTPKLKHDTL